MTDPGATLQLEIEESPRISPKQSVAGLSPGSLSIKAKSTSNIANEEDELDKAIKCQPGTPSTSSESLQEPKSARVSSTKSKKTITAQRSNSVSTNSDRLVEQLDKDFIAFVHQKELCKQKLYLNGFRGCFYRYSFEF